jgi:hypothetical protein
VLGIVEKAGVVTVLARPIDVAFENNSLHVVVEQAPRHPAQGNKGALVAVDQRADFHVGDEFDVACPTVPQRGAEGVEGIVPFAEFNPIDLHLLARCRLEADDRIGRQRGSDAAQIAAQLAQATLVALGGNLTVQYAGRYPQRMGRLLPFPEIRFIG